MLAIPSLLFKCILAIVLVFVISLCLRGQRATSDLESVPFALQQVQLAAAGNTLQLLHVIHRHGERTPLKTYANDQYKNGSKWPEGWAHLTLVGKRQVYELGQFLRRRYRGLIGEVYNDDDVYVRSTDMSRTLMSAEILLAALYPPGESEVWNPGLNWQPVPVHTLPTNMDTVLNQHFPCLRYNMEEIKVEMLPEMRTIREDNRELYSYLQNHSGDPIKTLKDVFDLHDELKCEQEMGLQLPDWTSEVFPNKTEPLFSLHFFYRTSTAEMKRIKAGPLLNDIVTHLRSFVNGTLEPPSRKIYLYSSHDSGISSLMHILDLFWPHVPPAASALLLELHKENDGQHVVKILYRNDTSTEPYLLEMPNCKPECHLENFLDITSPLLVTDLAQECVLQEDKS